MFKRRRVCFAFRKILNFIRGQKIWLTSNPGQLWRPQVWTEKPVYFIFLDILNLEVINLNYTGFFMSLSSIFKLKIKNFNIIMHYALCIMQYAFCTCQNFELFIKIMKFSCGCFLEMRVTVGKLAYSEEKINF